jgi:hypothetical protein
MLASPDSACAIPEKDDGLAKERTGPVWNQISHAAVTFAGYALCDFDQDTHYHCRQRCPKEP